MKIDPTFCSSRFSTGRPLAIEAFTFFIFNKQTYLELLYSSLLLNFYKGTLRATCQTVGTAPLSKFLFNCLTNHFNTFIHLSSNTPLWKSIQPTLVTCLHSLPVILNLLIKTFIWFSQHEHSLFNNSDPWHLLLSAPVQNIPPTASSFLTFLQYFYIYVVIILYYIFTFPLLAHPSKQPLLHAETYFISLKIILQSLSPTVVGHPFHNLNCKLHHSSLCSVPVPTIPQKFLKTFFSPHFLNQPFTLFSPLPTCSHHCYTPSLYLWTSSHSLTSQDFIFFLCKHSW